VNQIFVTDADGNVVKTNIMEYSNEYAGKFHTALNGMVESQMKKAVTATASFYGMGKCGKPDLSNLDAEVLENATARP
jgi:hypothetical protein